MLVFKVAARIAIQMAVFGGVLFLPAGTATWWRAWIFLGVAIVGMVLTAVGLSDSHEGLLAERLKPSIQKSQPFADKIILSLFLAAFYGMLLLIPLDVFRFHLAHKPDLLISSLGLAGFIAGWWICYLALRENAFAAVVVKHQEERRQTVVDTGIYGIVRHPMYAGLVPSFVGLALWLESYAAAILAILPIGLLVVRILVEERFLKRQLDGYGAYASKVRYRLIPLVW